MKNSPRHPGLNYKHRIKITLFPWTNLLSLKSAWERELGKCQSPQHSWVKAAGDKVAAVASSQEPGSQRQVRAWSPCLGSYAPKPSQCPSRSLGAKGHQTVRQETTPQEIPAYLVSPEKKKKKKSGEERSSTEEQQRKNSRYRNHHVMYFLIWLISKNIWIFIQRSYSNGSKYMKRCLASPFIMEIQIKTMR